MHIIIKTVCARESLVQKPLVKSNKGVEVCTCCNEQDSQVKKRTCAKMSKLELKL